MKLRVLIPASLVLMTSASISSAINLTFTGTDLASPATGSIKINGGSATTVSIGKLSFTSGSTVLKTFCIDAVSTLNNSPHSYNVSMVNLSASTGIAKAGRILATSYGSTSTKDQQAGMQLALWSAIYDGGASFNANGTNFKVTGVTVATLSFASSFYTAGIGNVPTNYIARSYITSGKGGQSQLAVEPVPEPASIAAIGIGLVGLMRRRKK